MIVRLSRAKVRRNSESVVFDTLRAMASETGRPDGLVQFVIARKVVGGDVELVSMSVWRDMDSLIAALGPTWSEPDVPPALKDSVWDHTLEHLESVVATFDELVTVGG